MTPQQRTKTEPNQPAAGKAAIAARLTVGRHCRGLPERQR
jgi:hypothetical protein